MTDLNISKTTVLDREIDDYSVDTSALDTYGDSGDTYWDFNEATQNFGYYKSIPELKKAVDALACWTAGKGFATNPIDKAEIERIRGWGEDSFQSILKNMIIVKKIVGDSFAEIVRNENGDLINLKPISPERIRVVVGKNGLIKRYEVKSRDNTYQKFKPKDIFHLCNDRIGDEIHGISVIDACKWVIDARNEAMTDYRKVLHRNVIPVRIIEVDTDDTAKRNAFMTEYKDAINKGEVLVIPKGTVEFKEDQIQIQDPIAWIQYLENFFYQAVGIPKVILGGSDAVSEGGQKVGYLTFEQVYMSEQTELEQDILNQLDLEITFNRPVSLKESANANEEANTSQLSFQPKDMMAGGGRE